MAVISPPAWIQAGSYDARTDRLAYSNMLQSSGVVSNDSLAVTQSGTPAMNVVVSAGGAYIGRGDLNLGYYSVRNDGNVTVTVAPADATFSRIDLVLLRVYDAQYSGSTNLAQLEMATGTASASPTAPSVPTGAIEVARITVPAGASSIVNANISRAFVTYATLRSVQNVPLAARPLNPTDGQIIKETDTNRVYMYNSALSRWMYIAGGHGDPAPAGGSNGIDFNQANYAQISGTNRQPLELTRQPNGNGRLEGSVINAGNIGWTVNIQNAFCRIHTNSAALIPPYDVVGYGSASIGGTSGGDPIVFVIRGSGAGSAYTGSPGDILYQAASTRTGPYTPGTVYFQVPPMEWKLTN